MRWIPKSRQGGEGPTFHIVHGGVGAIRFLSLSRNALNAEYLITIPRGPDLWPTMACGFFLYPEMLLYASPLRRILCAEGARHGNAQIPAFRLEMVNKTPEIP